MKPRNTCPGEVEAPEFDIETLVHQLSDEEKDAFLVRLIHEEPLLSVKLLKRLQQFTQHPSAHSFNASGRTIGAILQEADQMKRKRKDAERRKKEVQRRKRLAELEAEEPRLWEQVYRHISEKMPKAYDAAIAILKDLRMLAEHKQTQAAYEQQIRKILEEYRRLSSLKSKIAMANLLRNNDSR